MEVSAVSLVVVGVDGSHQSQRALSWALPYASGCAATVQAIMTVSTKDLDEAQRARRWAEAEGTLQSMVSEQMAALEHPPTVSYDVIEGDPAVVLVDATRGADLVVLGSHGMSSIRNPVLGSVSLACIRLGSCPVLVIPAGRPEPVEGEDLLPF
jgi:nucleotide-binding universal stress UspA family protein